MENALISVIVPVYNAEKYLAECVQSIISQTYRNLEIILVDDGSKDSSGSICDSFAEKDSRIKVIHQENAGVSAARNHGLDECHGEYVSFVDSDDYYSTNLFESAVRLSTMFTPPDLFEFSISFTDTFGNISRTDSSAIPKNTPINIDFIRSAIIPSLIHVNKNTTGFGAWVTNKLFKKSILDNHNIRFDNNLKIWEDGIFTVEYLKYTNSIISIDINGYHYRDTPKSLSEKHENQIYDFAFKIYDKYRQLYFDEYNFDTDFAKKYRFDLIHGITMREFGFLSGKLISKDEIRKTIECGLSNKQMATWLFNVKRTNPFFLTIEILLRLKLTATAVSVYQLYYTLKNQQKT